MAIFFDTLATFLTPQLSETLALVSGYLNKFSTKPLTLLGLDNIVHFPTRDQADLDHIYANHPSLFATHRRAPLSTSYPALIRIMPKIYCREHHQAFIRRSCRVIYQRVLAPSNIVNYQSMLEATDLSIFKSQSINEYADSLSDCCQFCFDTCCPLETIYVSTTTR